jgi:hypothetical protein
MSAHLSPPSDSSKTELEIVVNWRMIALGAALAVLLVVVPVAGFALFGGQQTEAPEPAVASGASRADFPQRAESPHVPFDPAAIKALEPPPRPAVRAPEPAPVPVAASRPAVVKKPPVQVEVERTETTRPAEVAQTPARRSLTSSFRDSEYELARRLLAYNREFDMPEYDKKPLVEAAIPPKGKANEEKKPTATVIELAARPKSVMKGLPFQEAKDCTKSKEAAKKARDVSLRFRRLDSATSNRRKPSIGPPDLSADMELARYIETEGAKFDIEELATLVQMFQVKAHPVRLQLVKMLARCKDARASVLLAERALFDLSEAVRQAAINALSKRPRVEYRATLLEGFRHPWPPVAEHAAEALSQLQDVQAVPKLATLLDAADPAAPCRDDKGQLVVKELVRINHLRNCVLCHAPSQDEKDPMRAPIPSPGQELPEVYYQRITGPAIHADVTYLRQNFSVLEPVKDADPWPTLQRFDYVVRTRELTAKEVTVHQCCEPAPDPTDYPQRHAVLFALRDLTGEDAGTSSAEWRRLLGKIGLDDSR